MNYGFNIAAGGVLAAMHRQDVAANNLANIETAGFKIDQAATIPRAAARDEDGLYDLPSNKLLERLGAGVLLAPSRTAFTQGPLQSTSNPLDVAIQGDGFFMIQAKDAGKSGKNVAGTSSVTLTRDGRFTLDRSGKLVTVADGAAVLDANRRPIVLNPLGGKVTIDRDGTIKQAATGQSAVAGIGMVEISDTRRLTKQGAGRFTVPESVLASARRGTGELVQGSIERSNVDAVQAMMKVTDASNDAAAATRIMSIHDELLGRAINTLGRVS